MLFLVTMNEPIAIDLSKQQALDADPRVTQQFNFIDKLDRAVETRMFSITEETKETVLEFLQGIMRVLEMCCTII